MSTDIESTRTEVEEITDEIDTPIGIKKFLEKRNGIRSQNQKNRYSVTELVSCKRKSFYKQAGIEPEELITDLTLEGMWSTVRGDFLHNMTYAYKWREMDMEYKVPLEDGRVATLVGRLDMYDWKTKTVIDLKSTKFVKWQIKKVFLPKIEHIMQLQCYDTIFSQYIPIENLNIVYVDNNDIVSYNVKKRDLTKWIQTRIQGIEDAITQNDVPPGEPTGLCQFCKYQTRCFNEGNGVEHKPLSTPKEPISEIPVSSVPDLEIL